MKKTAALIVFLFLVFMNFGCGSDPVEKAENAMQQKNFAEALRYYQEALRKAPHNSQLKENMAETYFAWGEDIYKRSHVLKAFEARIELGKKVLPDSLSLQMRKNLSTVYLKLALAYKNTVPENPYEKKTYFDQTLANLDSAIHYDQDNLQAMKSLQEFEQEKFQEMYEAGVLYYKKGRRDPLQYLAAEYYLSNALKLNSGDSETRRYLKLTRKEALNVLDPGQTVPFAITDEKKQEGMKAYRVVIHSQYPEDIQIKAEDFYLIDSAGNAHRGAASKEFATPLKQRVLKNGQEMQGVVSFSISKSERYVRLELRRNNKVLGHKNLP